MHDVTSAFRDAVRRRRTALGLPTPTEEILPRRKERGAFQAEAHRTLHPRLVAAAAAGALRRDKRDSRFKALRTILGGLVDALVGHAIGGRC